MGWFDSQIKGRLEGEQSRVEDAVAGLAEALTGRAGEFANRHASADAVADIMGYFGVRPGELPAGTTELVDVIEAQMRPQGIMYREVTLTSGWYKDAAGAILARRKDGSPVALLPHGAGWYAYRDHATGRSVSMAGDGIADLETRALLFYRPLPAHALTARDLIAFCVRSVDRRDWLLLVAAVAAVSLLGLLLPALNGWVFGPFIQRGDVSLVLPIAFVLVSVAFAQLIIGSARTLLMGRIATSATVSLSAAMMMRVLQLPTAFFKRHAAGDLAMRLQCVEDMVERLQSAVLNTGLTVAFSSVYLVQILVIVPPLALPAAVSTLASVGACLLVARSQSRVLTRTLDCRVRRSGWEYALIGGMQKIRLAGAERRAYATWADIYKGEVQLTYRGPWITRYGSVLQTTVALAGTLWIYLAAIGADVDAGAYVAFSAAYGMVSAALVELGQAAIAGLTVKPYLSLAAPIMDAVPEVQERRHAVGRVSGGIELNRVTFSYGEDLPPVLRDLSVKIRPGQYVGVVGRTGCGKSTLMRLLLGFEQPQTGAVYYDGRDLASLDLRGLRRNVGVVLQDGKLFQGDIYSNIVVSAPWLTLDDAWRAAELAGIADDIRAMPMGMQTMVLEGAGGLSGGQRQRIMIARAIVNNPKILMFDEATSALDNVTQKIVSDSLAGLRCTRIAIAHRLSTVQACDRILVLDGGRVAEDGTYDELMARGGIFAELVARQQV